MSTVGVFRTYLFSRDAKALRSGARTSRDPRVNLSALRYEYSASRLNKPYTCWNLAWRLECRESTKLQIPRPSAIRRYS
jgi:hypothetical protein